MANEITLKDLYDIIDKRFAGLEGKVEKYHDAFVHFEEGKVSDLIQRVTKLEGENKTFQTKDTVAEIQKQQRMNWIWGAAEKMLFALLGAGFFIAGLILQKLGILNLK